MSIPLAVAMALILLLSAIIIAWLINPWLGLVIIGYGILQVAYNLRLKKTAVVDIIAIATGFVLRATAGAVGTEVYMSPWFIICTAMLALFLGIEKRKAELRMLQIYGGKTRSVLKRYSLPLLNRMETIVTANALTSYALWSSGPTVGGSSTPWMLLTFPFVLYGLFRYQLLSDPAEIERRADNRGDLGGRSERPEEILLTDLPTLLTVVAWICSIFLILWLKKQGFIS